MAHKGFYFNQDKCMGCRTCQIACKDKNDLGLGIVYRAVNTFEVGTFPNVAAYQLSHTCNHCESPACVANCPTGAMYIDDEDGTTQHDDEVCIGCETCVKSCPYEVPQYLPELKITGKCDACLSLRKNGEENMCVASCPMRALEFGDIEELRAKHPEAVDKIAVLPEPDTAPSLAIDAKPAALEEDWASVLV
ncbi:4Fe-4S dicluster domain-containing protein [Adlercreutzia sp. R21]|uniref:4Fe-4S dicluster domain-containing protein n=1 Tax=Adlercreutzia wanghongyangiae TaxID=3111451 RepID=UPI002DBFB9D2|nr:4Fe-4S dicluster domain-containing protein [Adlercreutzia sp. R21]MEC4183543.1 4Fe-4S dicluster domain-containing protein [Adlercreutzia sp. R21]